MAAWLTFFFPKENQEKIGRLEKDLKGARDDIKVNNMLILLCKFNGGFQLSNHSNHPDQSQQA